MFKFLKYCLIEENGVSHHVTFMRTNPISRMHEKLVNDVIGAANKENASHTIFLTRTHDKKKNPLTPEQKIKHARAAFPNANVQLTSPDAPTMLHQASQLHKQGVNHLHVHVGSDRVDDFQRLLNTYNGREGNHGNYNFNSINVHPIGGERTSGEGDEGISGTKMRAAVTANDRDAFAKMAPLAMNKTQKNSMFNDVRDGMYPPKEEIEVKPKKVKK